MQTGPSGDQLLKMIANAEQKFAADRKSALEVRAARAFKLNADVAKIDREAYLNQMPRARGFKT